MSTLDLKSLMHKKIPWYKWVQYRLENVWEFLTYRIWHEIKWAWQRVFRKWDDTAVWSIDYYLSEILPPMLRKLKEDKLGIPTDLWPEDQYSCDGIKHDPESERIAQQKWDCILDNIIYTFETARKIQEHDVVYYGTKNWKEYTEKFKETDKKLKNHVMTFEECELYERGWYLFQEYFYSLWD